MRLKLVLGLFLAALALAFPVSSASAETVNITDGYVDNVLSGNCVYVYSKRLKHAVSIEFKGKDSVRYRTEKNIDVELKLATRDGKLALTSPKGTTTLQLEVENNKSFLRNITRKNSDADPAFVGSCKTSWSDYKSLPALPAASSGSKS